MTMRAVTCEAYNGPGALVVREVPAPVPASGELLVAVEAAGLGFVDALIVSGGYQIKPPLPFVPGSEVAGRVVEVGDPSLADWVGRRVVGYAFQGALAELALLKPAFCAPLPKDIASTTAAGLLTSYCTALYGLVDCANLQAGETTLVLGASGGVGAAALDLARGLGARTVAAASVGKRAACEGFADVTINYEQADWRERGCVSKSAPWM